MDTRVFHQSSIFSADVLIATGANCKLQKKKKAINPNKVSRVNFKDQGA